MRQDMDVDTSMFRLLLSRSPALSGPTLTDSSNSATRPSSSVPEEDTRQKRPYVVEWFYFILFFLFYLFLTRARFLPISVSAFRLEIWLGLCWKCYVRFKARERDNIRNSSLFGAIIFNQMRAIQRETLYFPSEACLPRRVVH